MHLCVLRSESESESESERVRAFFVVRKIKSKRDKVLRNATDETRDVRCGIFMLRQKDSCGGEKKREKERKREKKREKERKRE